MGKLAPNLHPTLLWCSQRGKKINFKELIAIGNKFYSGKWWIRGFKKTKTCDWNVTTALRQNGLLIVYAGHIVPGLSHCHVGMKCSAHFFYMIEEVTLSIPLPLGVFPPKHLRLSLILSCKLFREGDSALYYTGMHSRFTLLSNSQPFLHVDEKAEWGHLGRAYLAGLLPRYYSHKSIFVAVRSSPFWR